MGNDPQPLEVKLTGARRLLLDIDGADWRVAFYRPANLPHHKALELEKRARIDRAERRRLERLRMLRTSARDPDLRTALTRAMPDAELHEVEQVVRYVLEGRYAGAGRS